MHSIRQSCQAALRSSNTACIYAIGSRRAFSRSSALSRGALPVFLESSSPELTKLLQDTNSKILLPFHLTAEQKKLVYRKENQAKLEAEPVEITLGDVTLALEHIDRLKTPRQWDTVKAIFKNSETREDWENVVRVVEGYHNAGIPLNNDRLEMVIRLLNMNGMHHVILKALQRVKATGLSMREWPVLRQVLRAVYDKAALSDWDEAETYEALRMARQVAELLEDEGHCGGQPAEHDFRGKPAVVAVPTALAAVRAHKHSRDVEEVKPLAGRLMAALEQDNYMATLDKLAQETLLTTADFTGKGSPTKQTQYIIGLQRDILTYLYIKTALETSIKVLKDDMPEAQKAQKYATKVSQVLAARLAGVEGGLRQKTRADTDTMSEYIADVVARSEI